ncbi:MAG: nucleotide sugar dehydrogenase [Acidobacteria bacterium]|nr:nucleotide sugar dehydrogenase [Acidobacteriota bacterium]
MSLKDKIRDRKARIGVIGLGYVGLPLAVEFAMKGFDVTGLDVDESKIKEINAGRSYILDVKTEHVKACVDAGRLRASSDMSHLKDMDAIDICVPTPLRKTKDPDLSYVVQAVDSVKAHLKKGQLVILESTTYPGTTDEVVQPALEENGLKAGVDFYLAFSPERVDPGNETYSTRTIPKVVGGVNRESTELASDLYGSIVDTVVPVSSTQVAEMVKLLENTFRAVNIGLVNEIALMAHRMNIDVWEVIDAAGTKPFGFMPFYPGPGLGGHCIPIDPFYLSWKARQSGFECRFIELAGHVNSSMPAFVVDRIGEALNTRKKAINGSRIHILGVAYKKDVSDMRESPALDVIELLHRRGASVTYSDPFVPVLQHGDVDMKATPEGADGSGIDCAVICTNHRVFDYAAIVKRYPLIVDTRNALKGIQADHIFRL